MAAVARQPEQQGWLRSLLQRRWFRVALLLGVLIFELGFIWFIRHFGWLESINIWIQIGVVAVAVLPLLIAAAFLVRRRFSIKSAFVALTMITLFLGFTFRPVYEAKRVRAPAKKLMGAGVQLIDGGMKYETKDGVPVITHFDVEKSDRSRWWMRLLGGDAVILAQDEVFGVQIEDAEQLAAFAEVSDRFPNLCTIWLSTAIPKQALEKHRECFGNSAAVGVFVIPETQLRERVSCVDALKLLEGWDSLRMVAIFTYHKAPELFLDWKGAEIENLSIAGDATPPPNSASLNWRAVFNCPTFQNLKVLSLNRYAFSKTDAAEFASLQNLRSLYLQFVDVPDYQFLSELNKLQELFIYHPSTLDFGFLKNMASLKKLQIVFKANLTDDTLPQLPLPNGLHELLLNVPKAISVDALERIRQSLPDGCKLEYHRF